jgi:hypothetical protein
MSRLTAACLGLLGCASLPTDDLSDAFDAQGLTASEGVVDVFRIEDCQQLDDCFGNNASSPYLLFYLPGEDGAPDSLPTGDFTNPEDIPTTLGPTHRLRDRDAVVITGITPPASRYFGITPYLFGRYDDAGEMVPVFASLADTVNQLVLSPDGESPWQRPFALIVTSDQDTEQRARQALASTGLGEQDIHTVPLDRARGRFGFGAEDDTWMMLGRVALFEDASAGDAFLASPTMSVYRVTGETASQPLTVPPRTPRGGFGDESALQGGLDALDAAIRDALADVPHEDVPISSSSLVATALDPTRCVDQLLECKGDNSDTTYAVGPLDVVSGTGSLTLQDDAYFVIYGVNHAAAGRARYANTVIYEASKRAGVVSYDSDAMPGSAAVYLPDHPDRDALFAVEVRRDCGDRAHCITLPSTFPGVAPSQDLFFVFRAYLDPEGLVSPDHSEILTERVIWVRP